MNLQPIGRLIAERRRARLTLSEFAAQAAVGRSTLAALGAGKLPELGLARVARIGAAVDLVLEARPLELEAPILEHRHLTGGRRARSHEGRDRRRPPRRAFRDVRRGARRLAALAW